MTKSLVHENIEKVAELVGTQMDTRVKEVGLLKALNSVLNVELEVASDEDAKELKEALVFLKGEVEVKETRVIVKVDFANVVKGLEKFRASLGGE